MNGQSEPPYVGCYFFNGLRTILTLLVTFHLGSALLAGSSPAPSQWVKVDEGKTGERSGSELVWAPDLGRFLLVGLAKGAPFVQAFDPAAQSWGDFSAALPAKDGIQNYYQTAYDAPTRTVYCLSGATILYSFSVTGRTWKAHPAAPELDGLSWLALACDPAGRRLVVVGADKQADNLGWTRTVVYDIPSDRWTRLQVAEPEIVRTHKEWVAATEAAIDLVGHLRLAWYRDPAGLGAEADLLAVRERCASLARLAVAGKFAPELERLARLLEETKTPEALKAARALQRGIEGATQAQYPAPLSRRNSPLVFAERSRLFLLFGGDHEDYLLNDTWLLDLEKKSWRRAQPGKAPSPRAGHALCYLPRSGRVACYEGYVQNSSADYGALPYRPLSPLQLWLYDPGADRWDLAGSWPSQENDNSTPAPVGFFHGYSSQYFSPPALAAGADDTLVLAGAQTSGLWFSRSKRPSQTWTLGLDVAKTDAAGREKLGVAPDQRLYRSGAFLADYGEAADAPQPQGLDNLPANRWIKLPPAPRNLCHGCRQRDWGTSVWDSDRDQILLWGGGHCVRSSSSVVHYSPASGRMVESYDADEPYSANGGGGYDSSVLNRPWVSTHNYNHYAYDPKCRLLVSGRGYLYDPGRMDWLRLEPIPLPYVFAWGSTCLESSPHGAVAWARKNHSDQAGLWLFDREKGWVDLQPKGTLFVPYCDSHGMVYDARRDRMIFSGVGGAYQKPGNGSFLAFDFKTRMIETITPANAELNRTGNARELAYIAHADWILVGELHGGTEGQPGRRYTRVYDCASNRMGLLEAGPVADRYNGGWLYDARRKLAYVFSFSGEAWAMKIEPQTARLLDKPPHE